MDNNNTNNKDVEVVDQQPKTPIQKCKDFFKKHQREIALGAIAFAGISLEIYNLCNKCTNDEEITETEAESIIDLIDNIESSEEISEPQQTRAPHTTTAYMRRLPNGQKLSPEKKEQMMTLNLPIDDGRVLVNGYSTEDHR